MTLLVFALVVFTLCGGFASVVWWTWLRLEERKQQERMRQTANGGGADMPPWVQWRERRRR